MSVRDVFHGNRECGCEGIRQVLAILQMNEEIPSVADQSQQSSLGEAG